MSRRVLIIEDSNDDFQAIVSALGRACADVVVTHSRDGDDALDLMRCKDGAADHLPQVILLDLNLPGTDGREVLADIKGDELLRGIPVVILSTSTHPKDIADCYDRGANGYCTKPISRIKFDATIAAITSFWFRAVSLPERG
jgi:CheY-like chemotaxis protein